MLRKLVFNLWYLRHPPWDTHISPPELLRFIQSHPPGRALDLGCGTGTNVITLAQNGWQAVGVDFIPRAVHQAKVKARQAGVQADFFVNDVTRIRDIHGFYDLILDIGCFHGLPEPARQVYVRNLQRFLAPGGTFLLYTFIIPCQSPGSIAIGELELQALAAFMELIQRSDGMDRNGRVSAWLEYRKL